MADAQRDESKVEIQAGRNAVDGSSPTHLDLFSGIGGFALAAQWAGFRTIGFCEIDKYCRKVLAKNFLADAQSLNRRDESQDLTNGNRWRRGNEFNAISSNPRIHSNIFDLDGTQFRGVSLITGGFPCQPFSVAGKRRGSADDRAIWPQMWRIIAQARPAWVLGENVPGIIPMELDNVLSDLEGIGYAARAFVIPACSIDARHRRDRLWVVGRRTDGGICADSNGDGLETVSDDSLLCEQADNAWQSRHLRSMGVQAARWEPEPDVGRVAHGIRSRVDRLKGLGNAIVPQVAYEILREIRKLC